MLTIRIVCVVMNTDKKFLSCKVLINSKLTFFLLFLMSGWLTKTVGAELIRFPNLCAQNVVKNAVLKRIWASTPPFHFYREKLTVVEEKPKSF